MEEAIAYCEDLMHASTETLLEVIADRMWQEMCVDPHGANASKIAVRTAAHAELAKRRTIGKPKIEEW